MSRYFQLAHDFVRKAKARGDRPNWDLVETAFRVGYSAKATEDRPQAPVSSPSAPESKSNTQ